MDTLLLNSAFKKSRINITPTQSLPKIELRITDNGHAFSFLAGISLQKTDGFTNRCYGEMKLAPVRVAEDKYPTSVISIPKEHKTGAFYHPTQKPVALIEYLMRTYTNEGDVVLDNCIGSGTTAIAAIRTGRHYIGFEIEPTYCEIAGRRIREELERGHGIKESEIREIKK